MTISQDLVERIELVEQVGELHLKGLSATEIGRRLGVKRTEVARLISDWKLLLRRQAETSSDVKNKVMDILFESEQHFETLRRKAWETVEQADEAGQLNVKNNAIKIAASITKDIVSMFHDAGVSYDTELIEELNEREHNEQVIISLLKEIKEQHPEIADIISQRLEQVGEERTATEIEVAAVER